MGLNNLYGINIMSNSSLKKKRLYNESLSTHMSRKKNILLLLRFNKGLLVCVSHIIMIKAKILESVYFYLFILQYKP